MARCYVSGKTTMFGKSHTHHRGVAGGRWKKRAQHTARTFKPNLQTVTIIEDGMTKKVKLSTKVIKRINKDIVEGRKPVVQLAYPSQKLQKYLKRTVSEKTSAVSVAASA
jgi:large subunit ribosomal protein L28